MNKEFIPYEQALELKELGFEEICVSFFTPDGDLYQSEGYYKYKKNVFGDEVVAPLYQQAFNKTCIDVPIVTGSSPVPRPKLIKSLLSHKS